jgi:transcriptional regulator with XRE-family HTH domain
MAAPKSQDPENQVAAELIKRLIDASEWTHQTLGEEMGVSPGRVSQWATNRGAVPVERALELAGNLNTLPELISPTWAKLQRQFLLSQLERLTAATILRTVELTRDALARFGKPYSGPAKDPELFAEMLRLAILETAESSDGERGVWEASGPGGGATGTKGKAKDGHAARSLPSARRNRSGSRDGKGKRATNPP